MYANANNGSANSNTNNGVRLAIITSNNRSYGKPLRDGGYLRTKEPSLGNSNESWKAGTSQGAAYERLVTIGESLNGCKEVKD